MSARVVLLGPQRFRPTVGEVVRGLGVEGQVATVTAGWQEREPDDAELDGLLEGRSVNLELYRRWQDVVERDPEFAAADARQRERVDELQAVYQLRLGHAVAAVEDLERRAGDAPVWAEAVDDAVEAVRALDARHLALVGAVQAEFREAWPAHERPAVAAHRAAVAERIGRCDALAVGGGHVAVLLWCLQLFDVAGVARHLPLVAWSAGAMSVTERVVLFHDRAAHDHGHPEVYAEGLGMARGIVALPHARRRLRLHARPRMALLARRFAPAACLVLDDGAQADLGDGSRFPPGATVIGDDGVVRSHAA